LSNVKNLRENLLPRQTMSASGSGAAASGSDIDDLLDAHFHNTVTAAEYKGWRPELVHDKKLSREVIVKALILYLMLGGGFNDKKLNKRDSSIATFLKKNSIAGQAGTGLKTLTLGRIAAAYPEFLLKIRQKCIDENTGLRRYEDSQDALLDDPALTSLTKHLDPALSKKTYMAHARLISGAMEQTKREKSLEISEAVFDAIQPDATLAAWYTSK